MSVILDLLPVFLGLIFALFLSFSIQKGFNLEMFLICSGMVLAVLIYHGIVPVYTITLTFLLYIVVFFGISGGVEYE